VFNGPGELGDGNDGMVDFHRKTPQGVRGGRDVVYGIGNAVAHELDVIHTEVPEPGLRQGGEFTYNLGPGGGGHGEDLERGFLQVRNYPSRPRKFFLREQAGVLQLVAVYAGEHGDDINRVLAFGVFQVDDDGRLAHYGAGGELCPQETTLPSSWPRGEDEIILVFEEWDEVFHFPDDFPLVGGPEIPGNLPVNALIETIEQEADGDAAGGAGFDGVFHASLAFLDYFTRVTNARAEFGDDKLGNLRTIAAGDFPFEQVDEVVWAETSVADEETDVLSHTTLNRIIDENHFDLDTLYKACKWLNVRPSTILGMETGNVTEILNEFPELRDVFTRASTLISEGKASFDFIKDVKRMPIQNWSNRAKFQPSRSFNWTQFLRRPSRVWH